MSDKKISELSETTTVDAAADYLVMVDATDGETKKVLVDHVQSACVAHINVGNLGAPALAPTPGTPDPAALAYFGQAGIAKDTTIQVIHMHTIEAGTGVNLVLEIYRRRSAVMTLIATLTLSGTVPEYNTLGAVPAGDLASVEAGDYLFAQATAATFGGVDGLTIDIHLA